MIQIKQNSNWLNWKNVNGISIVIAMFGVLCGLTGVISGCFEILQGNIATTGFVISTIGSKYNMAGDFTYFAVTIIPNFLMTRILAIVVSCLLIMWSVRFVHRKNGVLILFVLSITQMLVGGGWVIDLAIITCILATRIDKPLNWWRTHLPTKLRFWLAKLLPYSVVVFVLLSFNMLVLTILGINDVAFIQSIEILAATMFMPILLMIFGGLAHDIERKLNVGLE